MNEQWREIPGWEGFYAISTLGRVKSLARSVPGRPGVLINKQERVLKQHPTVDGYVNVALTRNNKKQTHRVHRLVLLTFVGPAPEGTEACHNDGDKLNNTASNLRWDTRSANTHDKVRHGAHPQARKTHCPAGHAYSGDNVYIAGHSRRCRTCVNTRKRLRRAQAKEAA